MYPYPKRFNYSQSVNNENTFLSGTLTTSPYEHHQLYTLHTQVERLCLQLHVSHNQPIFYTSNGFFFEKSAKKVFLWTRQTVFAGNFRRKWTTSWFPGNKEMVCGQQWHLGLGGGGTKGEMLGNLRYRTWDQGQGSASQGLWGQEIGKMVTRKPVSGWVGA